MVLLALVVELQAAGKDRARRWTRPNKNSHQPPSLAFALHVSLCSSTLVHDLGIENSVILKFGNSQTQPLGSE
eukprot:6274017-Amphidinium_carterae.1